MTKQQVLDLYFLDARHKLIELAAFLDRVERAEGKDDFRLKAFRAALTEISGGKKQKAKRVQLAFSDPTTEPIDKATAKAACGAFPGKVQNLTGCNKVSLHTILCSEIASLGY
jgi:hypothetical protein